jgi:hypothetical protein
VTAGLEALKNRLASMRPEDIPAADAQTIAAEISAIRLQLKRLEADRTWIRAVPPRPPD